MYEIIRTFTPIFRGLNYENPRAAAAYYVSLIINFPTNFQGILNEAQAIYGNEINRQALHAGRQELQRNGIVARTYFTEDADVDFDRETYLPVNPEIIWQENQERANTFWRLPEEMSFRKTKVEELYEYYLINFKKYGLGIESGSITGLFNFYWMQRTGINVQCYNFTKRTDTMLNSLELYMAPDYFDYYEKIFKRGIRERILADPNTKILLDENTKRKILTDEESNFREYIPIIEQRRNKFKKLCEDFREQIEIRYTPMIYTTSRQSICYNEEGPYLASDLRKLLSLDPKEPPYYIGTIYLQKDLIDHIRENFEAAWVNSVELDQI